MSRNGLYLRPHLVFYPWTDRLPEEEMLISPFASGQLAFQHLCNCHIFLNIWDDIVVPIVKYQVSNSCLSASKFLRLIKGEHLWVVTMMITGNLTNPEEMVARYVRFMFKSDKKGRRKEVDLKENRSSRDGDKVLWERPHITVGETYLASGVETQPDGERIIFVVQIIKMHDLSATCTENLDFLSQHHSRQISPNQRCPPEIIIIATVLTTHMSVQGNSLRLSIMGEKTIQTWFIFRVALENLNSPTLCKRVVGPLKIIWRKKEFQFGQNLI